MAMSDLENRVADLEIRLVFQDDTIQSLSETVAAQQMEMEKLRRAVEVLARRQADLASSLPSNDEDQPPPHY
ncbi:SlyX family protein [uncultured Halopseudomonas sp.]|uniref:SlyX family protein n=1 Tax=uncultured Halopseudomonas sp. TaxID=2901193 RepID=UPI0030EB6A65